jgi:hypothetical protein
MSSRVAPLGASSVPEPAWKVWGKRAGILVIIVAIVLLFVWLFKSGTIKIGKRKSMTSCDKGGTLANVPLSDVKRCWMKCCAGTVQLTTQTCHNATLNADVAAPSYGYKADGTIEDPPGPC